MGQDEPTGRNVLELIRTLRNAVGRRPGVVAAVLAVMWSTPASGSAEMATLLRQRVMAARTAGQYTCSGELVCGLALIPSFYAQRDWQPAWYDPEARDFPLAADMLAALGQARAHGLRPGDYHRDRIAALVGMMNEGGAPEDGATLDLELLLTDAFLLYGAHLAGGRVDPETLHTEWLPQPSSVDLAARLGEALAAKRIRATLDAMAPPHPGYRRLMAALARVRRQAEAPAEDPLPPGPALRPETEDGRVLVLRRRLSTGEDASPAAVDAPARYDPPLVAALVRFQKRHGLAPDGIVGRRTRAALNLSPAALARRIEINLERWRWIPADLGRRYIRVDIAAFGLRYVVDGTLAESMRVVVGRRARKTPVLSKALSYLVVNPLWNVPSTIAVKDLRPKILADPGYLAANRFQVFPDWSPGAAPLDAATIDWAALPLDRYRRLRLVQGAGANNALGRIKFIFPNHFAVYLHDTPARQLFHRPQRDFSSGCIRVERPLDLAASLLADDPEWHVDRLKAVMDSGERRVIPMRTEVMVHIQYWTAWADADGGMHYRDDVYGRDAVLDRALNERPPVAPAPKAADSM
jgi:L,D-transpeptidase YcbB